jgi:hypothetical protein
MLEFSDELHSEPVIPIFNARNVSITKQFFSNFTSVKKIRANEIGRNTSINLSWASELNYRRVTPCTIIVSPGI